VNDAAARRTLWVVDPSMHRAETQGVERILEDWPGRSRVFTPALDGGDGPGEGDGYAADGIVVMGSAASVHDSLSWMDRLSAWLRPLLTGEVERPLLGICFGHQLIAWLAGGEIGFLVADRAKRVGVEHSALTDNRLLPGARELRVVVSHREEVKRAPEGYRVVARRAAVEIDGLEHRVRPIHTFQFHPEAGEDFAEHAGIAADSIDDRLCADSRRLLGAFREAVLRA